MDGRNYADFFLQTQDATQRRYEALRAVFVEGESTADIADRMSIPRGTLRNWCCEFRKQFDANGVAPFFSKPLVGVPQVGTP